MKFILEKIVREFCQENGIEVILSYNMPVGYETAYGTYDVTINTLFLNTSILQNAPKYEVLFYLFHELRHAMQYLRPMMFDDKIKESIRYVILYNGICYKLVDNDWKECILSGDEGYFTRAYMSLPYEIDANTFAYEKAREMCGDSAELKELFDFWSPKHSIEYEELRRLYYSVDEKIQLKFGYDIFGKAYGVMLKNDLHSPDSIDHYFLKTMVLLDGESHADLYKAPSARTDMSKHELYAFSQQFKRETEKKTIDAVLEFTRSMASDYDVPFEEMLFGGTEKQIIERGTDWCADMARVCCVILKCLNIPCRILHLADTARAYNGHVVCEAFYENEYGVVDPIYGFAFYKEKPISGYYLLKNQGEFNVGYNGYMELYRAIAVNEYSPLDACNNYSVTSPNEYYLKLISAEHNNKWFMGEDKLC